MSGLPKLPYGDGIRKYTQTTFKGYNHRADAQDGEIWDMTNLTSDYYPILAPRKPRYTVGQIEKPNGLYANDGLYWVDGTRLFVNGEAVEGLELADSRKTFAGLGAYVVILPDKKYYNRLTGEHGSLEAEWSGPATIRDGYYVEEAAKANTIYSQGVNWSAMFKPGDGVTISGCAVHEANNQTLIIREIEGDELRFYENSFVVDPDHGDSETAITVKRAMPDIDYICQNENRLWGCKGDEIYSSKLGDPFNWNVFDGVATDSYAVTVGSEGDFTGCIAYLGYPVFFKEEHIYKVYGDRPSNYQVMGSASLGVEKGSSRSLAIAGETLFYLSRTGLTAYTGGIPKSLAAPFGGQRFGEAVSGSDGVKYYVSMKDQEGAYHLFVYDTDRGLIHREDDTEAVNIVWNGELYCLTAGGELWMNGNARSVPEGAQPEAEIDSVVEFGDFIENNPNKKGTSKLQVRIDLGEDATVKIEMKFDSEGDWHEVSTLTTHIKRSYYLPIIPRRSDHFRIRLTGRGDWKLYSLVRENYIGSEL